jgi:hypothetical protein
MSGTTQGTEDIPTVHDYRFDDDDLLAVGDVLPVEHTIVSSDYAWFTSTLPDVLRDTIVSLNTDAILPL